LTAQKNRFRLGKKGVCEATLYRFTLRRESQAAVLLRVAATTFLEAVQHVAARKDDAQVVAVRAVCMVEMVSGSRATSASMTATGLPSRTQNRQNNFGKTFSRKKRWKEVFVDLFCLFCVIHKVRTQLCSDYLACFYGFMRAIGYVRVSTDKQADHGVSLEAQQEKVRAMATVHSAELVDVVVDAAESAKSLDRPGMEQVLAKVRAGTIDMVIVAKLDRLTRSVKDLAVLLELFQRRNVSLVSVAEALDTGSAAGRLLLNIMVSVSQWEREAIGERTRDAMRHKKAKREFVGNAPYGFRLASDRRHVEPEPDELGVLRRIRRMRESGNSLRKIADRLNRARITTRQGSLWRHEYVARLLKTGTTLNLVLRDEQSSRCRN
jgi:site-specific DNA recombinase